MFCPVCKNSPKEFVTGGNNRPNCRCPYCGSLERHRSLYLFFENIMPLRGKNILAIAPLECMKHYIEDVPGVTLISGDINSGIDLTVLQYKDATFDVVIALHVLEHIEDEDRVMKEIWRVLKPDGVAVIMVPLHQNPDPRYGHVRRYDDLEAMAEYGFKIVKVDNTSFDVDKQLYGLADTDIIWQCTKFVATMTPVRERVEAPKPTSVDYVEEVAQEVIVPKVVPQERKPKSAGTYKRKRI